MLLNFLAMYNYTTDGSCLFECTGTAVELESLNEIDKQFFSSLSESVTPASYEDKIPAEELKPVKPPDDDLNYIDKQMFGSRVEPDDKQPAAETGSAMDYVKRNVSPSQATVNSLNEDRRKRKGINLCYGLTGFLFGHFSATTTNSQLPDY